MTPAAVVTQLTRQLCGGGCHLHNYSKGHIAPGVERLPSSFLIMSVCILKNMYRQPPNEHKGRKQNVKMEVHVPLTKWNVPAISTRV